MRFVGKNNLYNDDILLIEEGNHKVYLIANWRKEVKKEDILKRIENAERELQEAKKELENINKVTHRWFPDDSQHYFRILNDGTINNCVNYNNTQTKSDYNFGNCFKTQEDAQRASERIKIKTQLEDIALELNKGKTIDWEDSSQHKYCISYNFDDSCLGLNYNFSIKIGGNVYCLDSSFLDIAIERIGRTNLENYMKGE